MKLLIIRPEPGATASAARAKATGFDPILVPLFEVRPRRWTLPSEGAHEALLVTSANAIRHAGPALQSLATLPVHAVGIQSADAAREAGLKVASTGSAGIEEVLQLAAEKGQKRLLWLAGEDHKTPEPFDGIALDIVICYASEEIRLPADAGQIVAESEAVALHSQRAAKTFARIVDQFGIPRSKLVIAAFSAAIAEAAGIGWRGMAVAAQPTDSALLSALAELVKLPPVAPSGRDKE